MTTQVTSYILENDVAFKNALERLARATNDFRIPFGLIAKDFYRSNKKIFGLKGPGLYPDLSEGYKEAKQRAVGFIYPIMVRRGRLASSLLDPSDPETVRVITKQNLLLGSYVPYLKYHQSDEPRTKMPLRKVLFIDGGPTEESVGGKNGRREAWLNILNQFIIDNLSEVEFK